jgi:hypothetical protein
MSLCKAHFTVPIDGCVMTSAPSRPGHAIRALLGFALRDPSHHWNMSYEFGPTSDRPQSLVARQHGRWRPPSRRVGSRDDVYAGP